MTYTISILFHKDIDVKHRSEIFFVTLFHEDDELNNMTSFICFDTI